MVRLPTDRLFLSSFQLHFELMGSTFDKLKLIFWQGAKKSIYLFIYFFAITLKAKYSVVAS